MPETKIQNTRIFIGFMHREFLPRVKSIAPLWGIGLTGVVACILLGAIAGSTGQSTANADVNAPKVLGDFIDLRGQSVIAEQTAHFSGSIDETHVTAQSYLVADSLTGTILSGKNVANKEYIASLTKLLTGLVSYEKADINAYATITPKDILSVNPALHLQIGDRIKLLDLFNAMMVGSNNDAALALANHVEDITGKNFIDLMNDKAGELSMNSSHFSNPMGFDSPGNYSNAEDLLKLVFATQKYAVFTQLGKKNSYSFTGNSGVIYKTLATDKLVDKYEGIEAVKTGFTQGAGQAMITKTTKDGHSVFIIVLDSKNREGDTLELEKQTFIHTVWE